MLKRDRRLVLGSASPRRRELLTLLGYPFSVIPSDVDEELQVSESTDATAELLAVRKARSVAARLESGLVVGADTLIDLDGKILGKPPDRDAAAGMLRCLRGRWHRVITGIAVVDSANGNCSSTAVATQVNMRNYSEAEILDYVASGEPMDKAGAYAIQERGGRLVGSIDGCYNNVVGLPLCRLVELLWAQTLPLDCGSAVCSAPDGRRCSLSTSGSGLGR